MSKTKKHLTGALGAVMITAFALLGSGCASIVHSGSRNIAIGTTPQGAKVSIRKTDTGEAVHTGTTPLTVALDQKGGYFKGQSYTLKLELEGYKTAEVVLRPELSGWYFGNIIFGGLIGMIVVDPLTGAMWNLSPDKIHQPLTTEQTAMIKNGEGFVVVLASDITPAEQAAMVRIN